MSKKSLLITIAAICVMLVLVLMIPFMQPQLDDFGNTSDLTPVSLKLGNNQFEIPKAYLWYKPNWAGEAKNSIHMVVTLPDYRPYSEETKIMFKGGPGVKYKLSFDLFKKLPGEKVEDIYFKDGYLERCEKNWKTFKVCPYDRNPELFEVMVNPNGQIPIAFVCPALATQRSPFCHMEMDYGPDLKLKIGLHETQLMTADAIIPKMLGILKGFEK
ncbi:hypothetical protein RYZ26_06130 [Terasakiella sp. A23]|uniref:hypothetical protein n=1 Tax=Terasakiella sp. FCG-A23 TaxID=3080561 RepID=UPI002954C405|nr:hypothetical protein [Terasakiella sp. A23]MDV7339161.1 hypothetical protein [Terasakiella sp. A23]